MQLRTRATKKHKLNVAKKLSKKGKEITENVHVLPKVSSACEKKANLVRRIACPLSSSKRMSDITNTPVQASAREEKATRRATCMSLLSMDLTMLADQQPVTPSILHKIRACHSSTPSSSARSIVLCQKFKDGTSAVQSHLSLFSLKKSKSGDVTGSEIAYKGMSLKGKQICPKSTSSPVCGQGGLVVDGMEEITISPILSDPKAEKETIQISISPLLKQQLEEMPDDILEAAPNEWFPERKQSTNHLPRHKIQLPSLDTLPQDILECTDD
ncbi:uncharacterized protein LOC134193951 isoform X2 [Corticium candelabrum]|uniref:uncharacterized protein LOC134193951 isoform X2 n=1 Tax=Corticium candelabrum TaxID=121492 RepID=UPI002E274DAF|nr:uncharacterized protein LOC134193951 isoform X2 [Corticium candelabrum]